jgi:Flp pilus assembly protein TadD
MSRRIALVFALTLSFTAAVVLADKITLKDGTMIEGVAIKQGEKYWVKTPDGNTRMIPLADVTSITKGDGAPSSVSPQPATPSAGPAMPAGGGTANFAATKSKADRVTAPLAAVTLWQKFIDENPKDADLATAQAELAKWQKLADEGAEKINNKWVGGEERKAILEKAEKLNKEAWELMTNNQTLPAMRKLEDALKTYPNSFRANFAMGYLQLLGDKHNEATRYLDAALRLNPKNPQALNNMGVLCMRQQKYVEGITYLYKGAENGDSKPLVQNLVNAIAQLPPAARNTPKIRPAMEAASLLASKYGIGGPTNSIIIVGLPAEAVEESKGEESRFGMSSGTGFFINDEGLILTNRHVVKGAKSMLVVMSDRKQRSAEVVMIDDEQDLALIKLKPAAGGRPVTTPFVQLAKSDNPGDGAECVVMGYPLIDRLGGAIKITRGIVSSGSGNTEGADVVTDAKVNPGNSGGPLLDRNGNVIGIVTMKSGNSRFEDSYGLAISSGKIRKFLAKNNVTVTPAAAAGTAAGAMSVEDVAVKVKPATVCIICTERERERE